LERSPRYNDVVRSDTLAIKYARDSELTQRLEADQTTLRQIIAQRTAQEAARKSSNKNTMLAVLGIIGLLALIGAFGSNKSASRSAGSTSSVLTPPIHVAPISTSPIPAIYSTPTSQIVPSSEDTTDDPVYRVPKNRTAELEQDWQEVEAAKARAAQFSSQIESFARTIESNRAYLNRNDQFEVDKFNAKVNHYNSMLAQGKGLDRAANRLVEEYNAKLKRYSK
jgi:hypothetical protein